MQDGKLPHAVRYRESASNSAGISFRIPWRRYKLNALAFCKDLCSNIPPSLLTRVSSTISIFLVSLSPFPGCFHSYSYYLTVHILFLIPLFCTVSYIVILSRINSSMCIAVTCTASFDNYDQFPLDRWTTVDSCSFLYAVTSIDLSQIGAPYSIAQWFTAHSILLLLALAHTMQEEYYST